MGWKLKKKKPTSKANKAAPSQDRAMPTWSLVRNVENELSNACSEPQLSVNPNNVDVNDSALNMHHSEDQAQGNAIVSQPWCWIEVLRNQCKERMKEINETVHRPVEVAMSENMAMQLSFIEPIEHYGEYIHCMDGIDIESEIEHWKSSMVCFVLGANPPLPVIEGFAKKVIGKEMARQSLWIA